jgi:hypothetical protein
VLTHATLQCRVALTRASEIRKHILMYISVVRFDIYESRESKRGSDCDCESESEWTGVEYMMYVTLTRRTQTDGYPSN